MIKFSGGWKEKLYAAASRRGWNGPLFVTYGLEDLLDLAALVALVGHGGAY